MEKLVNVVSINVLMIFFGFILLAVWFMLQIILVAGFCVNSIQARLFFGLLFVFIYNLGVFGC